MGSVETEAEGDEQFKFATLPAAKLRNKPYFLFCLYVHDTY